MGDTVDDPYASESDYWTAYCENLRYVLSSVHELLDTVSENALRKHIVGESEHLSKSVFECFSPWFAEELTA